MFIHVEGSKSTYWFDQRCDSFKFISLVGMTRYLRGRSRFPQLDPANFQYNKINYDHKERGVKCIKSKLRFAPEQLNKGNSQAMAL